MSRRIRTMGLGVIAILLFLTTGCWSSKEIEELSIYVGLGLDLVEEQEEQTSETQQEIPPTKHTITAIVQVVPQVGEKKERQSGTGTGASMAFVNRELSGSTLLEIFRQFALRSDRPIIGHHLKVIVLSSELTRKYTVEQLIDFIIRDNDIRPSCLVLVCDKKAADIFASKESGTIPAFQLTGMVDNQFRSNKILHEMSLFKLEATMHGKASFLLQNVSVSNGERQLSGAGVYHGKTKKWIGYLSNADLEGLSWIIGDIKGGFVNGFSPETGQLITYEIKKEKTKVIPKLQDGQISFHVKVESEGWFIEDWSNPRIAVKKPYMKEVEKEITKVIQDQIEQALHKMQKTYRVDVAGFRDKVRIKYPKYWKKVEDNWDEVFSDAKVTYEIDTKVTEMGSSIE